MRFIQKKQVKYTLGTIGIGALLFGIYKLYKYLQTTDQPKSAINSGLKSQIENEQPQNLSYVSLSSEHLPYETLIEDMMKDKLRACSIETFDNIKDLSYRIILSLTKGNSYQGIVNVSFFLQELAKGEQNLCLNFDGGGIKYLMVNGKPIEFNKAKYINHKILISKQFIKQNSKNTIQIIFQNFYSFLNQGLSTYFMVDQNQKYSLRQQVIYSINSYLDIEKIIPCFNCLNQCKVQIEVIHSDTFEVFSNTSKSLERLCSVAQYQKYPFLFDLNGITLNKSFKLNQSTLSNCSGIESASMSLSTVNYYNRKKANTHFYKQKLPCINHLFIFCSSMMELQPTSLNNPLESELLLRYFCKHESSHRLAKSVNRLHIFILDIFKKLSSENIKNYINKIDILIIGDREVEGYFTPGVILLSQDSLKQSIISIRCLYLVARALYGLLQLEKGSKLLSLKQILHLNSAVFNKFEQFRNYIFIKNKKFQKIRELINNKEIKDYLKKYQGYLLRYYTKQLRFILKEDISSKISFEVSNLMESFKAENADEFWQSFITNYNFLPNLIIEPLIKLGVRTIKLPSNPRLMEQLKSCFSNSKYVLNFYSNEEISDHLPKFIQIQSYGLEKRLTQVKVKHKFKDFITQKYEKYLPIRSNTSDAENDYQSFKQFNQAKNFHHVSVLKTEMKRVTYFGKDFIVPERLPINCSLVAWKLLRVLSLYPQDDEYYRMIRIFQGLPL